MDFSSSIPFPIMAPGSGHASTTPDSSPAAVLATPSPPPKKRLASCVPCRERHIKCSKERPACSSCRSSKHHRSCTYESKRPIRFRLTFAQPHPHLQRSSVAPGEGDAHPRSADSPKYSYQQSASSQNPEGHLSGTAARTPSTLSFHDFPGPLPDDQQVQRGEGGCDTNGALFSTVGSNSAYSSPNSGRSSHWVSLSNRTECDIFAFYTRSLGHWVRCNSNHILEDFYVNASSLPGHNTDRT